MNFDELVQEERDKQDIKWGAQNHKPSLWLAILTEEVGEASSEIIALEFSPIMQTRHNLGYEIVQIAAVAKAMYESLERNRWI